MIYVIVGPTASGKTFVANKIASHFDLPIINADAFQIYKGMDIGSAKIENTDPNYGRYQLLDLITPDEEFSVKQYQDVFRETLNKYLKEGKDVVVCGGTGLYIKASLYDYTFDEFEDDTTDLDELSNEELFEILNKLDPQSSNLIHPNNRKRIIRAISIARTTNKTKSATIENQEHKLIYDNVAFYMIDPDRDTLYEKINQRVDNMFEKGLVEETESITSFYSLSRTAKQAIGYKEVISYLNGELSLFDCKELIKKRTRNYAKRQWTFFNHQLPVKKYKNPEILLKELLVKWVTFLNVLKDF